MLFEQDVRPRLLKILVWSLCLGPNQQGLCGSSGPFLAPSRGWVNQENNQNTGEVYLVNLHERKVPESFAAWAEVVHAHPSAWLARDGLGKEASGAAGAGNPDWVPVGQMSSPPYSSEPIAEQGMPSQPDSWAWPKKYK